MRAKVVMTLAALAGFAVFGASAFRQSLTPYVSFREAKRLARVVQVSGEVDRSRTTFDAQRGVLAFYVKDHEGTQMRVEYHGGKPGNFDQASKVVCIGRCDGDVFRAEKLLLKCPSKYQKAPSEAGEGSGP